MIQITHLKALIAISQTGNMSNAARRLSVSQPALSQQIKNLEAHLGTELFQRNTNPVTFLPAGKRLLESAYEITRSVTNSKRDISLMIAGMVGKLRIAVECHSSFDWLLPSMAAFQRDWPDIQMDLVSGFQPDPVSLLTKDEADLVIVNAMQDRPDVLFYPLFRYEIFALLSDLHSLAGKAYLVAHDFLGEVLAHYPISDQRIDLLREVLVPANVNPSRRSAEITAAILHLVASKQAIAALPGWLLGADFTRNQVTARPVGQNGLFANLYAATTLAGGNTTYLPDFIKTLRRRSFETLAGIQEIK
ncbi:MAG: LysR family transcriptional regulator [Verrucomicrobiota bacterium]